MADALVLPSTVENQDDASVPGGISWPGTSSANNLLVTGGELILLNRGPLTSYSSSPIMSTVGTLANAGATTLVVETGTGAEYRQNDRLTIGEGATQETVTVQGAPTGDSLPITALTYTHQVAELVSGVRFTLNFGAYLNNGVVTYSGPLAGTNGNYGYFDGPWAIVPADTVDLTDPQFEPYIERAGEVGPVRDPLTQEYPIYWRAGLQINQIYSHNVPDGALPPTTMSKSHPWRGTISNGFPVITLVNRLAFVVPNVSDTLYWKTDDGSGDSVSGTGQGQYALTIPGGASPAWGSYNGNQGYVTAYFIDDGSLARGTSLNLGTWPYFNGGLNEWQPGTPANPGTPTNQIITFVPIWPPPIYSLTNHASGGTLTAGTHTLRYSFYKHNLVVQTNDGNGYTQDIETPLNAQPSSGQATVTTNGSVDYLIPVPDSRWDGVRLFVQAGNVAGWYNQGFLDYVGTSGAAGTWHGVSGGTTTYNGTVVQVGKTYLSFTYKTWTGAGDWPTAGFAAWPSGTKVVQDPATLPYQLMKWGHTDNTSDPTTGLTGVRTLGGPPMQQTSGIGASGGTTFAYHPAIITGGTGPSPGLVPAVASDGKNWTFVSPSGGSGMTNPMTSWGDMIRGGAGGVAARLPNPTSASYVLHATSAVTGVTITTAGSGYTSAPTVTFAAPTLPAGSQATGTATISGGAVTGVTITNPGSGYIGSPTVTFSAPTSGVRAQGTATSAYTPAWRPGIPETANGGLALTSGTLGAPAWTAVPTADGFGVGPAGFVLVYNGTTSLPSWSQISAKAFNGASGNPGKLLQVASNGIGWTYVALPASIPSTTTAGQLLISGGNNNPGWLTTGGPTTVLTGNTSGLSPLWSTLGPTYLTGSVPNMIPQVNSAGTGWNWISNGNVPSTTLIGEVLVSGSGGTPQWSNQPTASGLPLTSVLAGTPIWSQLGPQAFNGNAANNIPFVNSAGTGWGWAAATASSEQFMVGRSSTGPVFATVIQKGSDSTALDGSGNVISRLVTFGNAMTSGTCKVIVTKANDFGGTLSVVNGSESTTGFQWTWTTNTPGNAGIAVFIEWIAVCF